MFDSVLYVLNFDIGLYRECFDIIETKLDENALFSLGIKLNLLDKQVNEISYNHNIKSYD